MNSREFAYWLQGLFEMGNPLCLDEKQTELIRRAPRHGLQARDRPELPRWGGARRDPQSSARDSRCADSSAYRGAPSPSFATAGDAVLRDGNEDFGDC